MKLAPLDPDCALIGGIEAIDMNQRVERLMRIKALCGVLKPEREQRFNAAIVKAGIDATSADPANRTTAEAALGLLSLELCDE